MKSLPVWKCVNKTTPLSWLEKYERFLGILGSELGFDVFIYEVEKWSLCGTFSQEIVYTHSSGISFNITLLRKKTFEGGGVSFPQIKEVPLFTTIKIKDGNLVESRTELGNHIINVIRENWSKQDQSSS